MTIGVGIYTGGDPYTTTGIPYKAGQTAQLFDQIATAGYTTVVIWAAHIDAAGDIAINDCPVAAAGVFNIAAGLWAEQVAALKQNSSITRLELSIGGDQKSFANIKALINQYGAGPSNPLYGNLSLLKTTLKLDAVNFDDETEYDAPSSEALASMCVKLGMKVSICPYDKSESSYWVSLVTAINKANAGALDAIYVQCYVGLGNDPATWNGYFKGTGLTVAPGLWATHEQNDPPGCSNWTTASDTQTQIAAWAKETTLDGGWMFCGTDMLKCPGGGTPADYATAISKGLGSSGLAARG